MSFEKILETETDAVFLGKIKEMGVTEETISRMKNAMINSYYKYGALHINYGKDNFIDCLNSLILRLDKYYSTGNTEFLNDCLNFCMIEYMCPTKDLDKKVLSGKYEVILDYLKTGDVYLIVDFIIKEMKEPTITDTFFEATATGACNISGIGYKQVYDDIQNTGRGISKKFYKVKKRNKNVRRYIIA